MGPRGIRSGSIDQSIRVFFFDNTTGLPATGLVYNSSGMSIKYERNGTTTTITLATLGSTTAAHADGGFIHTGDGVYRLDLPDAAVASGAGEATIKGLATGYTMVPELIWLNTQNAADVADAIADEAMSGHTTAGTFFKYVADVYSGLIDAQAEPGQGTPAANASALAKISYLYKAWRNRKRNTGTVLEIYNDNATTVDHKAAVTASSGTTDVGEITTGP